MARWTDIASWLGPSPNKTAAGLKADNVRGVVIHIASGFYQGTIAWQRNPTADVSSHFVVGRDGQVCQMVDTADASWAQRDGNGTWLSVENEGFAVEDGLHASHPGWESLSPEQIEVNARILAKAHQVYGAKVPLQLASSPAGRGLGHHSMGAESGVNWGHSQCPGSAIKAQKPAILARAIQIANGAPLEDNDMAFMDDENAAELAWRTDALFADLPATRGGGFVGKPTGVNKLHEHLVAIDKALAAAQTGGVDPAAVAALVVEQLGPLLPTLADIEQLVDARVKAALNATHLAVS